MWNRQVKTFVSRVTMTGLDYPAIYETADRLRIPVTPSFVEKLSFFEHEVLKALREGGEDGPCNAQKRAQCAREYGDLLEWTCSQCEQK